MIFDLVFNIIGDVVLTFRVDQLKGFGLCFFFFLFGSASHAERALLPDLAGGVVQAAGPAEGVATLG